MVLNHISRVEYDADTNPEHKSLGADTYLNRLSEAGGSDSMRARARPAAAAPPLIDMANPLRDEISRVKHDIEIPSASCSLSTLWNSPSGQ